MDTYPRDAFYKPEAYPVVTAMHLRQVLCVLDVPLLGPGGEALR